MSRDSDEFELYNLEVKVVGDPKSFVCSHTPGHAFDVVGENILFNTSMNNSFSFYTLSALIPLFSAKQRQTHPNDWITTDERIACPDRNCGAQFEISRTSRTTFKHSEVTSEPLNKEQNDV